MTLSLLDCPTAADQLNAADPTTQYQLQAWAYYEIRLAGALTRIGVARPGEQRCTDFEAGLRCVRRPHPQKPHAHVRVAHDPWPDWEGTGHNQSPRSASQPAAVPALAAAAA
jgi:hypothetical protein